MTSYKILRGLDYPPLQRAEPGETRSDLPAESIPWLLADGDIEPVKTAKPKPKKDAPT